MKKLLAVLVLTFLMEHSAYALIGFEEVNNALEECTVDLKPAVTATYDIGSATKVWKNLYVGGIVPSGNITMATGTWIGLGAAKGRLIFTDAATDWLSFSTCNVSITNTGTSGAVLEEVIVHNTFTGGSGTGAAIRFDLTEAAGATVDAGLISCFSENAMTTTSTTQDTTIAFSTSLNGTVAPKVTILSNGYTGIGTETPATNLHLWGANSGTTVDANTVNFLTIESTNLSGINIWNDATGIGDIIFGDTNVAVQSGITYSHATDKLSLQSTGWQAALTIISGGDTGIGTMSPSALLDIEKAGTVTATVDFLEITNTANAASMTATGTGILWNQWYYDGTTPAVADSGRIAVITEGNWDSTVGNQDSAMLFMTALNGTVAEGWRINSGGNLVYGWASLPVITQSQATSIILATGTPRLSFFDTDAASDEKAWDLLFDAGIFKFRAVNDVADQANTFFRVDRTGYVLDGICIGADVAASAYLDIQQAGTATATTDLLELTNSGNAASMTATGTGILFNQWAYDASTPAVTDSGRISVLTEGNWTTADANTQDSKMSFQTALNGTVAEKAYIASSGAFWVVSAGDSYFTLGQDATHYSQFIHRDADDTLDLIVTSPASASTVFTLTQHGGVIYPPTAVQTIVAATGITAAMLSRNVLVQGSAGNIDITANPQIAAGAHGQIVTFIGQHNTNTVQFDTGTGLTLEGGSACILGLGDTLTLIMDTGLSLWCEQSRSNNN